jgi:hypothetical protein
VIAAVREILTRSRCRRSRTWWMIGSTDWEGVFNSEKITFFKGQEKFNIVSHISQFRLNHTDFWTKL